ncbi:uncharacterized protein [Lolium perenne]|uniref:uncharacterized protein n=1 Tax=Lolium perenne TaxID=4522 RepID=UPI003A991FB9
MAAALLRRSVRIQEPAPPPYVYGLGPGILSGGVITDMHCVTVRIIIETPALGLGIVFVLQMPDAVVVGPRHQGADAASDALPGPDGAARSSDALSRVDSCYTMNCSVAGLSDEAGATVSPGEDRGSQHARPRYLQLANAVSRRTPSGEPPMRPANLQNEDGGVQPTYARDTDEDGGGEDNVEAHSTAGFTSTRKCGLLPARCQDRQAFLSDLGRSPCQRETSPLLSERRPGHSHALCVFLVIPPSTSAIPHSKTALIIWRGSTDRQK